MGNRVLITGSRGIAAGLTQTLAKNNYQIYLLGGEAEDSKSLANDHSQVIGYSAIDLRDEVAVEKGGQFWRHICPDFRCRRNGSGAGHREIFAGRRGFSTLARLGFGFRLGSHPTICPLN